MSKTKHFLRAIVIAVTLCMVLSGVSIAQDKGPKDLNGYTCKDIMRMSGENRSIAIAFLHGYFLGKKGTTAFDTLKMAEATDQFIEYCLDNPGAKVLNAMSRFVK